VEAFLISYQRDTISNIQLVEISDDHDWSAGPYVDTVPFSVGSNQTIVSYEDGIDIIKRTYGALYDFRKEV
jgi:hypothetical protein